MRTPDQTVPRPRLTRRRRVVLLVLLVLVVALLSLRTFAVAFTDYLWFGSVHLHSVWTSLLEIKVGLFVAFAAVFGVLLFVNMIVAERLAPRGPVRDTEDEFVRRYQQLTAPFTRWIRLAVVVFLSIVLGSQAIGQWQHWILFRNAVPFGVKDPMWHKDIGYYVFTLPFQNFLVHWALAAVLVILLLTVVTHYLNGGIRTQGPRPRVRPAVKAHISILLGVVALIKAIGYVLQRYSLVNATDGYVNGAGYTDVHARLPALDLLILVSLAALVLLAVNVRRQGWALPALGVGLWFLVALTAGTIYPAAVQAFKVNPAQNNLEQPYIARNIAATRAAYGLNSVTQTSYPAVSTLTASSLNLNSDTLGNVRIWDPLQTQPAYDKLQDIRSYYQFNSLSIDRYKINNVETPVVVGVREINPTDIPSPSWVNVHLQYTHGYGMIISPANQQSSTGQPVFALRDVPPVSTGGLPQITQPDVYYGLNEPNYVVANSKTPEIDYQLPSGANVETHYTGSGGVQLTSWFDQAMFALRFNDLNLLISNQITSDSRVLFDRSVQTEIHKAAPFLSLDADPYPALVGGQIVWIQDAYTTTDSYPYAQQADTSALTPGSDLFSKNFNYVRNSVKIVVNAYTGQMSFYVMDPKDPIIRTYERAFPGMFKPASAMPADLKAHLRYPEDIFSVQAAMYGRYHITNPSAFYSAGDAWSISPAPGTGNPNQALATTETTNAQGQLVSTNTLARMAPIYQVMRVPGQKNESFNLLDAFVPVSQGSQIQTLSAFMIAGSDPSHYGQLQVFVTPRGQPVSGPALVSAQIDATSAVSTEISYLNQNGSTVLLGQVMMVPIADSLLYVQPLYVQSARNNFPTLQDVIAVYGKQAQLGATLGDALTKVFSAPVVPGSTPGSAGTVSPQVRALLDQAQAAYQQAQTDLKAGNLGQYQTDISQMESLIEQVQVLTGKTTSPTTSPSSSTTTTAPSSSTTTTAPPSTTSTTVK